MPTTDRSTPGPVPGAVGVSSRGRWGRRLLLAGLGLAASVAVGAGPAAADDAGSLLGGVVGGTVGGVAAVVTPVLPPGLLPPVVPAPTPAPAPVAPTVTTPVVAVVSAPVQAVVAVVQSAVPPVARPVPTAPPTAPAPVVPVTVVDPAPVVETIATETVSLHDVVVSTRLLSPLGKLTTPLVHSTAALLTPAADTVDDVVGLLVTGPLVTGPLVTGPLLTVPVLTGPVAPLPVVSLPVGSFPVVLGPVSAATGLSTGAGDRFAADVTTRSVRGGVRGDERTVSAGASLTSVTAASTALAAAKDGRGGAPVRGPQPGGRQVPAPAGSTTTSPAPGPHPAQPGVAALGGLGLLGGLTLRRARGPQRPVDGRPTRPPFSPD